MKLRYSCDPKAKTVHVFQSGGTSHIVLMLDRAIQSRVAKMDCISLVTKTAARGSFIAKAEVSQQGHSCAIISSLFGHITGWII